MTAVLIGFWTMLLCVGMAMGLPSGPGGPWRL